MLHEYLLEVRLSRVKHLVVEGITDLDFFRAWATRHDLSDRVVVVDVSGIHVEDSDVEELGLTIGNRGRVVRVAADAAAAGVEIRCVADRDTGHGTAEHGYVTLLWTDFPALESYALTPEVLDMANASGFARKLPPGDEVVGLLSFALRELFAVRKVFPHLEKPNYGSGVSRRGGLAKFDVTRCVDPSLRSSVATFVRPADEDPRHYAYGHDIAELLLAGFGNQLKNQAGISRAEAVEGVLMLAVLAIGAYSSCRLFVTLENWIVE